MTARGQIGLVRRRVASNCARGLLGLLGVPGARVGLDEVRPRRGLPLVQPERIDFASRLLESTDGGLEPSEAEV